MTYAFEYFPVARIVGGGIQSWWISQEPISWIMSNSPWAIRRHSRWCLACVPPLNWNIDVSSASQEGLEGVPGPNPSPHKWETEIQRPVISLPLRDSPPSPTFLVPGAFSSPGEQNKRWKCLERKFQRKWIRRGDSGHIERIAWKILVMTLGTRGLGAEYVLDKLLS